MAFEPWTVPRLITVAGAEAAIPELFPSIVAILSPSVPLVTAPPPTMKAPSPKAPTPSMVAKLATVVAPATVKRPL